VDLPSMMHPLPVLPDFSLIPHCSSPFIFRFVRLYALVKRYLFHMARVQTRCPGRRQAFAHMPRIAAFLAYLPVCVSLLVFVIVSAAAARAPTRSFAVYASRLLQAQFGLFELHQFGDEADVGRYPFASFGYVGVRGFEGPCIGVDKIG
jgi:hypothetical protein